MIEIIDYSVLSAILRNLPRPKSELMVIHDYTLRRHQPTERTLAYLRKHFLRFGDEFDEETLIDYVRRNSEREKVEQFFDLPVPYILLSDEEVSDIFSIGIDKGWRNFYQKFPRSSGLIDVSLAGCDSDRTEAIAYVGRQGTGKAGLGNCYLMKMIQEQWTIQRVVEVWIS